MEYTISKLCSLAGISTRTLRYYDEIGLLKPCRVNSSGYRIYGAAEVEKLQQIMFYKELGMSLDDIIITLSSKDYDGLTALSSHLLSLQARKEQLDKLITNVEKTISCMKGEITMSDKEKFEGLKQKLLDENEAKYGKEIREKYGEERIKASNKKFMKMSEEQMADAEKLAEEIHAALEAAFITGDPAGELAQKACDMHRQWLCFYWDSYSKEAHMGLGQMYVDDERFTKYYDKKQPGTAVFFRDALKIYTGV